jgi:hypothetical protein
MPIQPFRFLDLPADLRCMMYEEIEVATCKQGLEQSETKDDQRHVDPKQGVSMTLLRATLPMSLLATCRLIRQEATPVLTRKVKELVEEPVRLSIDWSSAATIVRALRVCLIDVATKAPGLRHLHISKEIDDIIDSVVSAINNQKRLRPLTSTSVHVVITLTPNKEITGNPQVNKNCLFFDSSVFRPVTELLNLSADTGLSFTVLYNALSISFTSPNPGLDHRGFELTVQAISRQQETFFPGSHVEFRNLDDVERARHRQRLEK